MEKGQYPNAPPSYQPQPNPQGYPQQPGYPGQQPPPGSGYAAPPPGPGYGAPPPGPGYGAPPQPYPPQPYPPQPVMQSSVQQSNTTVIIQQPQTTVTAVIRTPPPDYMGLSIFTCLCCFWPAGLVAIIFSSQVNGQFNAGNYEEAAVSALRARNCSYFSIGCAIVMYIIIIASVA